jgi:hypothetical protein
MVEVPDQLGTSIVASTIRHAANSAALGIDLKTCVHNGVRRRPDRASTVIPVLAEKPKGISEYVEVGLLSSLRIRLAALGQSREERL